MHKQGLELIQAMLKLIQLDKLTWSRISDDHYEAAVADLKLAVEFIYFARTDDVGSDRAIARVSAFLVILEYSAGTEEMNLLCEMLAFSDQNWSEMLNRCRQRVSDGINLLQELAIAN